MYISLAHSRTHGFMKWLDAHPPRNDDDNPGGATPIAVVDPPSDDHETMEDAPAPHRPWRVPGVGSSF
jgi:hypothetical protein